MTTEYLRDLCYVLLLTAFGLLVQCSSAEAYTFGPTKIGTLSGYKFGPSNARIELLYNPGVVRVVPHQTLRAQCVYVVNEGYQTGLQLNSVRLSESLLMRNLDGRIGPIWVSAPTSYIVDTPASSPFDTVWFHYGELSFNPKSKLPSIVVRDAWSVRAQFAGEWYPTPNPALGSKSFVALRFAFPSGIDGLRICDKPLPRGEFLPVDIR